MSSLFKSIDKRRRTYVRMMGDINHALNSALSEEAEKRGLTQAEIARILGKSKSFISRKLGGGSNMTLETLADIAYALDRPVRVSIPARQKPHGGNSAPGQIPLTNALTGVDLRASLSKKNNVKIKQTFQTMNLPQAATNG